MSSGHPRMNGEHQTLSVEANGAVEVSGRCVMRIQAGACVTVIEPKYQPRPRMHANIVDRPHNPNYIRTKKTRERCYVGRANHAAKKRVQIIVHHCNGMPNTTMRWGSHVAQALHRLQNESADGM